MAVLLFSLLLSGASAEARPFQACLSALTKAWLFVFPESRMLPVGDRSFHVYSSPIGSGGEGTVYRLFDNPDHKLKVFIPDPDTATANGDRIDTLRIGMLPQGYIEAWVARMNALRRKGLPVPVIHEVGRGFVVMDYIDGVSYKQLGSKKLGYSPEEVKRIRKLYLDVVEAVKAAKLGTLDGATTFGNLIWDPKRNQWFLIDA